MNKQVGQQRCGRYVQIKGGFHDKYEQDYLQALDTFCAGPSRYFRLYCEYGEECMGRREGEVTYKVVVKAGKSLAWVLPGLFMSSVTPVPE